jgi:hypothetical protein
LRSSAILDLLQISVGRVSKLAIVIDVPPVVSSRSSGSSRHIIDSSTIWNNQNYSSAKGGRSSQVDVSGSSIYSLASRRLRSGSWGAHSSWGSINYIVGEEAARHVVSSRIVSISQVGTHSNPSVRMRSIRSSANANITSLNGAARGANGFPSHNLQKIF